MLLVVMFIALLLLVLPVYQLANKILKFLTLFKKKNIVNNFRTVDKWNIKYNTIDLPNAIKIKREAELNLPKSFIYNNTTYKYDDWLKDYWTTGLMVLKVDDITNGRIVYEKYFLGNDSDTNVISWSVGKSIVSALVGIAVDHGYIKSIEHKVKKYLKDFEGTDYGEVKIKHLLTMKSGIHFDEDYFNVTSDINWMSAYMLLNLRMSEYLKKLKSVKKSGTKFKYISSDTQMLGLILEKTTGLQLTEFAKKYLWNSPEFDSMMWLKSGEQQIAFGTNFTKLENYLKFGWLYLNKGKSFYDGRELISEKWIEESTKSYGYDENLGYGYQWWIPPADPEFDDFVAIGVYNQFIYISKNYKIVIAKSSANSNYDVNPTESEILAVSAFRSLARHYGSKI